MPDEKSDFTKPLPPSQVGAALKKFQQECIEIPTVQGSSNEGDCLANVTQLSITAEAPGTSPKDKSGIEGAIDKFKKVYRGSYSGPKI